MAISPATLTVTLTESITLNGLQRGNTTTLTLASIEDIDCRTMTIGFASPVAMLALNSTLGAGTFDPSKVAYIRITNTDTTNFLRVRVIKTGSETADFKIDKGKSMIFCNSKMSAQAAGGAFAAFIDFSNIYLQADTAAIDIEYFIATT